MGILLALAAAMISAVFLVFMKLLSGNGRNSLVMSSGYQVVGALSILILGVGFEPIKFSTDWLSLVFLLAAFACWVGSSGVGMIANKYLDVSINVIVMQSSLVLGFFGSVIFYHDEVTNARLWGVGLVLLGNIVIFLRKDLLQSKISLKGVLLRILASACFSAAMLIDKYNGNNYSLSLYVAMTFIVPGVFVGLLARVPLKQYISEVMSVKWLILATGLLCAISYYALLKSFTFIDSSVALTINSLNSIFVVIIGVLFLKERRDLWRKALAVVIVFAGALILNFA